MANHSTRRAAPPVSGPRPGARPICGAIFDAARPADELTKIEQRVGRSRFLEGPGGRAEAAAAAAPSRRRRRDERLAQAPRRRSRACSSSGRRPGEEVAEDLARGLDELGSEVERRRDQEDARRRARPQQRDHHHPSRRRRHRVAGLGRDAAAHVPPLDGAPRLQARSDRHAARRRGRDQERRR